MTTNNYKTRNESTGRGQPPHHIKDISKHNNNKGTSQERTKGKKMQV